MIGLGAQCGNDGVSKICFVNLRCRLGRAAANGQIRIVQHLSEQLDTAWAVQRADSDRRLSTNNRVVINHRLIDRSNDLFGSRLDKSLDRSGSNDRLSACRKRHEQIDMSDSR